MFKYIPFGSGAPGLTERRNRGDSTPTRQGDDDSSLVENEDNPFPNASEEGPVIRVRDVFSGLFSHHHHHDSHSTDNVSVEVEHYIHDKSFRQRMILLSLQNSKLGIRMQYVQFVIFFIGCLLYLVEAVHYDHLTDEKIGVTKADCNYDVTTSEYMNSSFWDCLLSQTKSFFIVGSKPYSLWLCQVLLSIVVLFNATLSIYIITDFTCSGILKSLNFALYVKLFIPTLFLITLFYPVFLKDLFIPSFLYCWPGAQALTSAAVLTLQRNTYKIPNNFRIEAIRLVIFLFCFMFTWVGVLHHVFRNDIQIDFFDTSWFLLVTMSTVGYGDISPEAWLGKLLVVLVIVTAIIYIIPKLEELYQAFQIQQKLHNSVSVKQSRGKFVLICSTHLEPLVLRDFLTEFYSDPNHYDVHCVVMVEQELASIAEIYLSHPIWARRITVLIGSPLRLSDLRRARASNAHACFIHSSRTANPDAADQHTIMCAWSIKDCAPKCKLYVQILKPENRLHLGVADHIVVEGELKHALLANNSHCPGISTLVTLLLHTFKPEENKSGGDDRKFYSLCAPCEVYDSLVGESLYFHHFIGKNFLYAAVVAFRKYHVTLIGVQAAGEPELKLNPGLKHILEENDTVYYIGFTREEYSKVHASNSVRHSLLHACATLTVIAMTTSGINPYEMEQKYGSHEVKMDLSKEEDIKPAKEEKSKENVKFYIGENHSTNEMDGDMHVPDSTKQESHGNGCVSIPSTNMLDDQQKYDMMRGVQLLRYHSQVDAHSKGVPVKVCLLHRESCTSVNSNHQKQGSSNHHPSGTSARPVSPTPNQGGHVTSSSSLNQDVAGGNSRRPSMSSALSSKSMSSTHSSRGSFEVPAQIPSAGVLRPPRYKLSDVPEESTLERDLESHADGVAVFSLKEAEEGRAVKYDHFHQRTKKEMLKPPMSRHVSEPGCAYHPVQLQEPHSKAFSPPLDLVRSMSEGKLDEAVLEESHCVSPKPGNVNVRQRGRKLSNCDSSPDLTSHNVPNSSTIPHWQPFFRSISRKMSNMERGIPSIMQDDLITEDVLELELDDESEQNELVNIEVGCCESSNESDSEGSTTTESEGDSYTANSSGDEDAIKPAPPILTAVADHDNHHHHHLHHHHHHLHHHHHHHHRFQYEKGTLPNPPYLGFEASKLHLLLHQRPRDKVHLIPDDVDCTQGKVSMRDELVENCSHVGSVIVYCNEALEELYHFILPLRAHYLHASLLKPLVIMLKKEPDVRFVDTIAWLPLVYYLVGDLSSVDHWLKAGILLADSAVILCDGPVQNGDGNQQEHMMDAGHIMAVQKLSTLFPNVNIVIDIHYRYNMRFLKYAKKNLDFPGLKSISRAIGRRGDHLMYLFLPHFAAGQAFCSSMLDTLLYQSHVKPYIIDVIRQLLGCKQVAGSGFLWKAVMTPELLQLQTYDRVFQRLVSTHKEIPLGIYRTSLIKPKDKQTGAKGKDKDNDGETIHKFLSSRMQNLGISERVRNEHDGDYQSYVLPNPPPKTKLRPTDIILVLRSPHTPHPHFPPHTSPHASPHASPHTSPTHALNHKSHDQDSTLASKETEVDIKEEIKANMSAVNQTDQSESVFVKSSSSILARRRDAIHTGVMADDLKLDLLPTNASSVGIQSFCSPMETSSPVKRDKLSSQSSKEEKDSENGKKRKRKKEKKARKRGISSSSSDDPKSPHSRTRSGDSESVDACERTPTGCEASPATESCFQQQPYTMTLDHDAQVPGQLTTVV